ncbi:MAG TPA: HAMP domain-containing sensor histidine kinase [Anaeromyxobacter sp.]|nr:HAMP domain-containing sensor histidine kinase [Anaeromyxobacter sp.]
MSNGRAHSIFRRATSLRGKIAAGYVLGFLFLLAIASILFANLLVLEGRIALSSGIARFLDTTLEMRRYEKNYLLYQDPADLEAAVEYATSAAAIVRGARDAAAAQRTPHPEWLRPVGDVAGEARRLGVSPEEASALLDGYVARLREAAGIEGYPPEPMVSELRDLGRRITLVAERLSSLEGESVQELLRSSRRLIVGLVAVFLLGSVLLARVVRTTALRPLKALEQGMRRIAAGELALLPVGPASDEIASMNAAFNRMIGELFEHREEVMRSERLASLGTMLAGIAHELNNPLSNVSTSAELLAEQDGELRPEERRELIRQIVSETDRATEIIRTVLSYSRETRFERQPTNLLSTLLDSVVLVRGELPTHVTVDLDVPPDLMVLAHRARLHQAFINLMKNSIDAMREARREGEISITARTLLPANAQVELVFRDRGAGIPPHVIDRVFDPFFSTKDVGHGTGLGLYLVHEIVEQNGGTIRLESTPGEGTTVTIRLPAIEAAAAASPDAGARAQGGG